MKDKPRIPRSTTARALSDKRYRPKVIPDKRKEIRDAIETTEALHTLQDREDT